MAENQGAEFEVFDGAAGTAAFWQLRSADGEIVALGDSYRSPDGLDVARQRAHEGVEAVRQAVLDATPPKQLLDHLRGRVKTA